MTVDLPSASEDQKQRLAEHLLQSVLQGSSGRDGLDIVDSSPFRSIFAGVLESYRDSPATGSMSSGGTSLGLDFRVRPDSSQTAITLRIGSRWSHYYPVFPTWDQVVQASGYQRVDSAQQAEALSEPDDDLEDSGEDVTDLQDEVSGSTINDSPLRGRIVLPRIFRRQTVQASPINVVLVANTRDVIVGEGEIGKALADVRSKIASDPARWRHLSEPQKNERELGDAELLSSQAKYDAALKAIKNPHVRLPAWAVTISVDCLPDASEDGILRIRILLTNRTPSREETPNPKEGERPLLVEPDLNLQERALFDAGLEVSLTGASVVPFEFLLAPTDYRVHPRMIAKGINCVAIASTDPLLTLRTEASPIFRQPLYRARSEIEVRFDQLLGDSWNSELPSVSEKMSSYLEHWDNFLRSPEANAFGGAGLAACRGDRDRFLAEKLRFDLGLQCLRNDNRLARAFGLMNAAFNRLGKASGGRIVAWRLFQICFIVSQLPSLAVRELDPKSTGDYADELRAAAAEVGILWFPTGGGKTEAYLGLIATALLYDRLRGKTRGVCAWMRFPLRMLSLQQLERLGRVIGVLNTLRAETPEISHGDPFAIGYYVGDGVTPNTVSDEDMRRFERDRNYREEKRLLRKCFFCTAPVEIQADRRAWKLAHVCTNEQCFSNTDDSMGHYKGSLPVCIVDNEIYRYLPSVLVGTVDKLAIVGRNRSFVHLVRGVSQKCPIHGYASYDECIERWSGCKTRPKGMVSLANIKDPGLSLLIQDEFHLLRAELGVFNGHYEGLLQYLGEKAFMAPKILAATATIEAYDTHAFHIYLSKAQRFPQPSWQAGESFYATSTPARQRRYYIGIRCHTRSVEDLSLRILDLYQSEVRRLRNDLPRAVDILGAPKLSESEAAAALRLYDLSLVYVNKKATGGSIYDKLSRLEQQFAQNGWGTVTAKLLTGDQSVEEVGATIERIEAEKEPTDERLDVVIATNLISHGVDLERINMMCVAGMPSHYAEYVQSTSRAGRSHPGLVFVCFMARDPRELSQYEFFPAMHENMDRLIEAVAVNRFATFAPRKTVPGLLAGVLLCETTPRLYSAKKIKRPLEHVPTLKSALGISATPGTESGCVRPEELVDAIEQIIGVDGKNPLVSESQAGVVRGEVVGTARDCIDAIGRALEPQLKDILQPLTSFRDVDEGLEFGSVSSATIVTRLRAR